MFVGVESGPLWRYSTPMTTHTMHTDKANSMGWDDDKFLKHPDMHSGNALKRIDKKR